MLGGVGTAPMELSVSMVTAVTLDWLPSDASSSVALNLMLLYADSADGATRAVDLESRQRRTIVHCHLTTGPWWRWRPTPYMAVCTGRTALAVSSGLSSSQ